MPADNDFECSEEDDKVYSYDEWLPLSVPEHKSKCVAKRKLFCISNDSPLKKEKKKKKKKKKKPPTKKKKKKKKKKKCQLQKTINECQTKKMLSSLLLTIT